MAAQRQIVILLSGYFLLVDSQRNDNHQHPLFKVLSLTSTTARVSLGSSGMMM